MGLSIRKIKSSIYLFFVVDTHVLSGSLKHLWRVSIKFDTYYDQCYVLNLLVDMIKKHMYNDVYKKFISTTTYIVLNINLSLIACIMNLLTDSNSIRIN